MKKPLGIYVHIPFCVKKCGYCDFCSVTDFSLIPAYISRLCADIRAAGEAHGNGYRVDTVYFGGGTPSCAGTELVRALEAIRASFEVEADAEISFEANPATADLKLLSVLREAGFNRLSVGIQSADEGELKKLGRIHTFRDAVKTVAEGRAAGFSDVGGDMMLGIPDQTAATMRRTVCSFAALGLDHVSAYMLKIEPDTPFGRSVPSGLPDEEETAELYLTASALLRGLGYERYEISNFAKPGFESRHNLRYWRGGDYIGIGVSAASLIGNVRYLQSPDMKAFLDGKAPDTVETLDEKGREEEYLMLHLRLSDGIDKQEYKEKFGIDFNKKYEKQIKKFTNGNFAVDTNERFYLTDSGVFVSNAVITEFI